MAYSSTVLVGLDNDEEGNPHSRIPRRTFYQLDSQLKVRRRKLIFKYVTETKCIEVDEKLTKFGLIFIKAGGYKLKQSLYLQPHLYLHTIKHSL